MQKPPQQPGEHPRAPHEAAVEGRELLERFIKRHDSAAFEALMRLHGSMVLGVCRRVIGDHHDSEEAFQATFLVLARKAASVRPPEMLANWLYGVAYRTSLKMRTATMRRRTKERQVAILPELQTAPVESWAELAPVLDREVNRLPDKYRVAVICCDLEGLSREEAAKRLGWPEGTVKVRLMRARSILAKRLTRQGVVLSVGALAAVVAQNTASAAGPASLAASTAKAAGALAASKAASATAIGTKVASFAKGLLHLATFGKAPLTVAAAGVAAVGVTTATVLYVAAPQKGPEAVAGVQLPAEIQQALADNAKQLSPITVVGTYQLINLAARAGTAKQPNEPPNPVANMPETKNPFRLVWQDQKAFLSRRFNTLIGPDRQAQGATSEIAFDGHVVAFGNIPDKVNEPAADPPAGKAQTKGQPKRVGMMMANLNKRSVSSVAKSNMRFDAIGDMCFAPGTGLVIVWDAKGGASDGQNFERELRAESAILNFLHKPGGKLISVDNVPFEGKPSVRVVLDGENPIRRYAEEFDLEQFRRSLKDFQENRMGLQAEQRKQLISNYEMQIKRIEGQRQLPATCRYTYYLDPDLHYAVRRFEQRYDPDTLLARVDSSDFQKISGRQVWLPRHIETDLSRMDAAPGTLPKESLQTRLLQEISSFDGNRVPDETFTLNYTMPGTFVSDGTDPAVANAKNGFVNYTIPQRLEDLPAVIERARKQAETGAPQAIHFADVPVEKRRNGPLVTIVLWNVAALGAGAGYLIWRRRKAVSE